MTKLLVIVGQTGTGKTALGIELAKHFGGEVISADSRLVYREMSIGTAKPRGEWLEDPLVVGGSIKQLFGSRKRFEVEGIVHHGIDLVRPDEDYSVSDFKQYAIAKIHEITSRGHLPILVGGTGLWVRAVVDNLDLTAIPKDDELRAKLESRTLSDLVHEFKQRDPEGALLIDRQNKRRVVRALEVTLLTGIPWSQQQTKGNPLFDVLEIGLKLDRELLNQRLDDRVDDMIAHGLINEVRPLWTRFGCQMESMTSIGYRQLCAFFEEKVSLDTAIKEIKKMTRDYAKRQQTWFARDERIVWVDALQAWDEAKPLVENWLKKKNRE